ncbi:MAG: hypothetical protein NTV97_17205 [Alphaproteobacteria bacterium]|nr:hypothetical protein [Alphaproteobacteria bacterium]
MSERYFARMRREWIGEMLRIYGFINRSHIIRKFEVSTPQASCDLRDFMAKNPGAVAYDHAARCYRAVTNGD